MCKTNTCVCACVKLLSSVQLFAAPSAVVHQASLSMEFSRQEYWSGLPCPSPGALPDPGMEPAFLMSPAVASLDKKKADIKILMSDRVDFKIKIIKWKNLKLLLIKLCP